MNNNKTYIAIAIILIGGLFGYEKYRASNEIKRIQAQETKELNILMAKENEIKLKAELEEKKELDRQISINTCLRAAYDDYTTNWNNRCETRGKEDDCTLYSNDYEGLNDDHQREQDNCYKRY